eukprot:Skav207438  [mRNA]  locus=scaffold1798:490438:492110:+ [translate_table: standard]
MCAWYENDGYEAAELQAYWDALDEEIPFKKNKTSLCYTSDGYKPEKNAEKEKLADDGRGVESEKQKQGTSECQLRHSAFGRTDGPTLWVFRGGPWPSMSRDAKKTTALPYDDWWQSVGQRTLRRHREVNFQTGRATLGPN